MESLSYKIVAVTAAMILITATFRPSRAISDGAQGGANQIETRSAASYAKIVAPESIVVSFGVALATEVKVAETTPLPTSLAGTSVKVRDSAGAERLAPLFFVAPTQVNYQIPFGTTTGAATITITNGKGETSTGTAQIASVAPGIFSANADGMGVPAAVALRVRGGSQTYETIFRFDDAQRKFVPKPLDLGPDLENASDQVYLILYGTGIRARRDLDQVGATIGSVKADVSYASQAEGLVGVDQINVKVPRQLAGRGLVNLLLNVEGTGSSNLLQIEVGIPPGPKPPKVVSFNPAIALAGERLEINGSDFSSTASDNTVRIAGTESSVISNTANQLVVRVPFGAATGPITVRTSQGEGASATPVSISTSISGYVQDTMSKPLPGVSVSIRQPDREKKTNAEGAFVLPDVPPSPQLLVVVDGSTVPVTPRYEKVTVPLPVLTGRDNKLQDHVRLQQPTGPGLSFPLPGSFVGSNEATRADSSASPASRSISTNGVTFEVPDNTTAVFPGGGISGNIVLTKVEKSRTPVGLPAGIFSSTIIQLTPLGVKLTPGGKLMFPNDDKLTAGARVELYRLDQTLSSPNIGRFIVAGMATVSGEQIETAPDAVKETSYFFVAAPRPTTTVVGRVVDSDGETPVRNALVSARGRESFTDGNGGFTLLDVAVSGNGDPIIVEVSFHRPDGRVDRVESSGFSAVVNGVTRRMGLNPDIMLPSGNRPPALIGVPPVLSVTRGTPRELDFVANDPDPGQTVQVTVEGAAFATVSKVSESAYKLRLTPGADAASSNVLMVKATDNLGLSATEKTMLTVFDNRPPVLIVPNGLAMNAGQPVSLTISASDPDEDQTLAFTSNNLPVGATLTPITTGMARFSWTPGPGQIGAVSVNFRVTDNGLNNLTEAKSVAITVIGQWAPTAGPEGGLVRAFLSADMNLFAGVAGGVYRSSDQGQSWTATNAGIENTDITALAAIIIGSDLDLFAGSLDGNLGVYRSTDNGQSWQPANGAAPNDLLSGRKITALAVIGTTLFAGTEEKGLYQSTDQGRSWKAVTIGNLTDPAISSLAVIGTSLFVGTRVVTTGAGQVFRSSNLGDTWTPANGGLPNEYATAFVSNGGFLFVGLRGNGGVYRSVNNGDSWTPVNGGLPSGVYALVASGTKLFAGTLGGGIYLSADNGSTWTEVNTGLKSKTIYSLTVRGANLLAGTERTGVFRSSNDGTNWVSNNKGLIATQIRALVVNGATILAGTVKSGIFLSSDRGQTWTQPTMDIPADRTCYALAINGANIFAGTDGGVFRSIDSGQNWAVSNGTGSAILGNLDVRAFAINGILLFAGTGEGVFRSADNGETWTMVNKGLTNLFITSLAVSETTLFAGTYGDGVFRSTDNGNNWTQVLQVLPSLFANAITTSGGGIFVGGNGIVFRSTDNGDNWKPVYNGTNFVNVQALVTRGGKLLAGTFGGVFLSTDNGETWSSVNAGLTVPGSTVRPVAAFAVSGNNIFAGTFDFGVFVTQQ